MALDKIEALRRTPLFGQLAQKELQALADRSSERKLTRGEILFSGGDDARGLYVLVSGSIRAFRVGPDGREQVIHVERAPATFAEVPVFDGGPYPSTVSAEEPSTILFLDTRDVHRLCLEYPEIALAAVRLLAARLRKTASLVETLSLHDVDRRLANLMLLEARDHGLRRGPALRVPLALTHQQIATRIGTVREVVSRALSRLQQTGLVSVEGKDVIIPDENALQEFVDKQM
jgi:CRP/FNR family cyclic AMP-dependent transcriptional regulator